MRQIPYGRINFKEIITSNYLYVDKTSYFQKLESEPTFKTVFYLRPGRFGKSLFTSMLDYYYAIDHKDEFNELFGGLYVGKNPTENRNKYYVLNFDFSGIIVNNNSTIEDIEREFSRKVFNGINRFSDRYNLNYNFSEQDSAVTVLGNLFLAFTKEIPNEKIYIIIDEYDNFTNAILKDDAEKSLSIVAEEGFVKGIYERMKEEIKVGTVERFFATGIAPITLDSMTTGFNMARDITRYAEFVSMIGLTEEEVKDIIDEEFPSKTEKEREEMLTEMKQYYDGYRFSETSEVRVFNTTLVMYYLSEYLRTGNHPLEMMDMNIATNFEKLSSLITLKDNPYSKEVLEALMNNDEINEKITNKFVLTEELTRKDILSMLFYFGYCTIKDADILDVSFKIPNYVMSGIYNNYFMYLIKKEGVNVDTEKIREATNELAKEGKITKLCKIVEEYLSYLGNITWQRFDEKYIKGYMHAVLQLSDRFRTYLEYNVQNNKYIDVAVFRVPEMGAKYEAIIEVKYIKKSETKTEEEKQRNIKLKREEAIEQIVAYSEDKRLPQDNLKKFIVIYVGDKLEVLEEIF